MKALFLLLLALFSTTGLSLAQSPKTAQRTGTVHGTVVRKDTKAPVPGAVVAVVNDTLKITTDDKGAYQIKGVIPGYRTLFISADGYHPLVTASFMVLGSSSAVVNVELDEQLVEVEQVVVTASPLIPTNESPVGLYRIGTEQIDMTPGANRDISKVVQSTPGVVTYVSGARNDLLVRGGGANENKYFLDGIEIPVLNHFSVQGGSGGDASLVNTDLLRNVNFHTGAFPAQFANGVSSVMDMRMDRGNSERFHGKVTVGFTDAGASVDTPLSKNGKTTLLASYRRSYLQFLFDMLGLPFLPTYNDYQFKLSSQITPRDEIYLLGLGSSDYNKLNTSVKDPNESKRYILGYLPENRQSSFVVGAGYRHSFAGGELLATVSHDQFLNRLYKHEDNDRSRPRTMDYDTRQSNLRLRVESQWRDVGGFRITAGAGGGEGSYRGETRRPAFIGEEQVQEQFTNRFRVWRYELFGTINRRFFSDRLSVTGGIRADGMSYTETTRNPLNQLSPRASLSWKMAPKWNLNASVGRYHQEPTYTTMGYRDPSGREINRENDLRYMAVNHYNLGVAVTPNAQSRLSLEGFYKDYSRMPVSMLDSLPVTTGDFADYIIGDVPVRSIGRGRTYGMELSYRNMDLKNTVINVSYTLLRAEIESLDRNLQPSGSYLSSPWDVRHTVNVSAIHKFGRDWSLGAKWYFVGGYPYTPYDEELSSRIDAWDARNRPWPDTRRYNGKRSGNYHQLDVRVDKMWFFKGWRLGFYVDIQNLYNFKAPGQDLLLPERGADGAYIPDPNRPGHYRMNRVKDDFGGTVLPTLGITIEL